MCAKRDVFLNSIWQYAPAIVTVRAPLHGDQLCGHVYVAWPNYSNHCYRQQMRVSWDMGYLSGHKCSQRSIVCAQSSCFNFESISVIYFNSPGMTNESFLWPNYGYCYSLRQSKCLNGPNRSSWSLVLVWKITTDVDYQNKNKFKTIVLVILSVRVGDLITLLIIATRGQCKDVCVPENVRVGS